MRVWTVTGQTNACSLLLSQIYIQSQKELNNCTKFLQTANRVVKHRSVKDILHLDELTSGVHESKCINSHVNQHGVKNGEVTEAALEYRRFCQLDRSSLFNIKSVKYNLKNKKNIIWKTTR